MGFIYKIQNNINGKLYVGQTYLPIEQRLKQHILDSHNARKKNRPLCYAINKYGKENFSISLIEEIKDEEMNDREKYWINKLRTYIGFEDTNGYNATLGGDSKKTYDYLLIVLDYLNTKSKTQTAQNFNCCIQTVDRALEDYKIETFSKCNGRGICSIDDNGEIVKIYNSIREASIEISIRDDRELQTVRKRINKLVVHNINQKAYGLYWKNI